jgi:hypothetical protein
MANAIVERMIGAAKLDVRTYEEVEHDDNATIQAFIVVILVAIASGVGLLLIDGEISAFFGGLARAILNWIIFAAVAYFVGTRLIPGEETQATVDQLLRTMGFAQTPGLLSILAFIPVLGILVAIVVFVWTIVAAVVGLRQALDTSTGRAIGVALLSLLIIIIANVILAAIGLTVASF